MTTTTARVFCLPDLGEGLTEAGLVQWLVQVGDTIRTDQAIAEVETAKSIVELPSPFAGVITALHGEPGEMIPVGAPVLEVSPSHEGSKNVASEGAHAAISDPPHPTPSREGSQNVASEGAHAAISDPASGKEAYRVEERAGGSGNVLIGYGTSDRRSSGRRRPPARQNAQTDAKTAAATPSSARDLGERTASSREQAAPSPTSRAVDATEQSTTLRPAVRSPLVRRLARDLGVDVRHLTGTGADGAITRGDVLRAASYAEPAAASATASAHTQLPEGLSVASRERLSAMRTAISATLSRSRAEIPEATVWVDVDATTLWNARTEMAPAGGRAPSLTAVLARFTLIALAEFPLLAARLTDDATQIVTFDGVHLGVAADTARGLLVPVIPRAHQLSIDELDAQLRELAETARAGRTPAHRLRGSTFTLNNYGALGVDGSAAIINHPEVAILGIGRMIERPWVVDGEIVARRIAQLSLVFDHRVCDGGYAAGFLRRLVELIEHPLRAFGRIR
ncbi:dihydrolipoamide acetyltransferase family protein [Microbacterium sp. USHLN186]|uniref:dihydrolipoamide acetyltransferase family protein n=1 Tax=Microbacterium sp. USHLN186 TaxID=3081286 RepID=UPI00301B1515